MASPAGAVPPLTLRVKAETYRQSKDRVMDLANQRTRVENGESVADLRASEEDTAEIDGPSPAKVADIRTIAEIEDTPIEACQVADRELE